MQRAAKAHRRVNDLAVDQGERRPARSSCSMDQDTDFALVADVMLQAYGTRTLEVIQRRVADNSRDGNIEAARFWWRVALAIREPPHDPNVA
jgi:hypothetical protein